MNNKMMTSLGICLMLSMTLASASISIGDVETNYDKKSNSINFNFDATMNEQCGRPTVLVYDKKDNLVGRTSGDGPLCWICIYGQCNQIGTLRTGTFNEDRTIQLTDRKNIKGIGNLRYEIVNPYIYNLLYANGFLK